MRAFSTLRSATLAVAGGLMLFAALPAFAVSVINLDTGTDTLETMEPGGSGSVIFTLSNSGSSALETLTGWNLGIQFIPRVSTTGTLTVGSLGPGSINPVPAGTTELTQPTLLSLGGGASLNGSTQYYNMGSISTSEYAILAAGQTYEMGSVALTASGDAAGVWDVYAVQQNSPLFKTYIWNDAVETAFANVPWVGGGNYSVQLGSVEVVPEPSTIALLGLAGLGAGGYAETVRRRKRKAAVAGDAVAA